jgi:hypothetical protein
MKMGMEDRCEVYENWNKKLKLVVSNEYGIKDDVWRSDGNKMKNEYCKRII